MKRLYAVSFLAFTLLLVIPSVGAQTANDAILALEKVQALVQTGVNYRDYGKAVAEARLFYNLFMKSPDAEKDAALTEAITNAMADYMRAFLLWRMKMSTPRAIQIEDKAISSWLEQYPEAQKPSYHGGALHVGYGGQSGKQYYYFSNLLSIIWKSADKHITEAARLSRKP